MRPLVQLALQRRMVETPVAPRARELGVNSAGELMLTSGCSTRAGARPRGVLRTMGDLGSIEPKLLRWASSARMALGHLLRALQVKKVVLESARWLRTWRLMGNLPVLADVGMLCMIISTYSAKMRLVIPSPLVCTHQGAQWFTPSVRPCARPRPRALD